DAGLAVLLDADPAAGFAHLDHRALVDEQAGEFHRLGQRTAAVVAQVHDHAVHALLLELGQQAGDVAGGRGVVVGLAAARGEVLVEAGQLDHADPARRHVAARGNVEQLGLGRVRGQLDLVADQGHPQRLAVHAGLGRDDVQPHLGALRPLDLLDHVVDAPADHVLHRPAAALAAADDAAAGLALAALDRRA